VDVRPTSGGGGYKDAGVVFPRLDHGVAVAILFLLAAALVPLLPQVGNSLTIAVAFLLSAGLALALTPPVIRKMRAGGMVGRDVNKVGKPEVANLGGIAALFAFSVSMSFVVGLGKLFGNTSELPYLAVISVFFIAAMVGLIDDISNIPRRLKIAAVSFAALPLMLVHLGESVDLPFGYTIPIDGGLYFPYWLILVPIGVTGLANAINMSAGYNGLESGEIAIVSGALLAISLLAGGAQHPALITAILLGSAIGLFVFNRYPAKVFVGDIGTLGMGAALAGAVILGHIEVYAIIAIAPAFYEAFATFYYGVVRKVPDRRKACHNPIIREDGRLQPPPGAEHYTLAYLLLSGRPMTERGLVLVLLGLYAFCGTVAVALSVI